MLYKERKYPCNEEQLLYVSYDNAVSFKCKRSDLRDTIHIVANESIVDEFNLPKYFLEFGAWHAMEVYPKLNGFPGYDAADYLIWWVGE